MTQHQTQLGCREGRKIIELHQFYSGEEDNQQNLLKLFELFFFFFKSFKFCCRSLVSSKKCTANCTSVLLILYFTSQYIFQRKSKEWDFSWVLLYFLSGLLKKTDVFFGWVQLHQH